MVAGNDDGVVETELELEAMRRDDFSWHPCKVSLDSSGVGLVVEYGKSYSDDLIVTKEEALSRLRIRSTALQGDECSLIQEGDCVLASRNSPPMGLFFDARVEKLLRVRHSKKIHCRCAFVVRWIDHGHEVETATVPSSGIMKMSTKCVTLHPTIVAFFHSLTAASCCKFSPLPTVLAGMDCEMEGFELEKQIQDISNAADASGMEISDNIIEVSVEGQTQCKASSKSNVSDSGIQLPPFINHMKEIEINGASPPQEEFGICRTPLNPIAACTALASLMSKFSQSSECSPTLEEVKAFRPQAAGTNATFVPKYENIVKTLFPTKEVTGEPKIFDASKEESKNEECHPQIVDSVSNVACSTKERSSEVSCKNVEMTCIAGQKLMPSINTRRFTRSAVREAEGKVMAEVKTVNKEKPSSIQERDLTENKTLVSPADAETASTFTHKHKDQVTNPEIYQNDSERENCAAGIQTLNNSRRLTRSAGRRKTENNNVKPHQRFEESRLSDNVKSDISNGDITSESNASETENQIFATLPNGISSTHTVERYKKVQKASLMGTTPNSEGDAASKQRHRGGVKRKSIAPKKQELRFSPRLRFLPRTRSQNQS